MAKDFKPSEYTIKNAIEDTVRYGKVKIGENFVMKDHGGYYEVHVDADNEKGHMSFNAYYDENGNVYRIEPHKNN